MKRTYLWVKRICAIGLILLLAVEAIASSQMQAKALTMKEVKSADFHMFLAKYLKENPTVNDILRQIDKNDGKNSTLANHILYSYIEESGGISAEELQMCVDQWDYVLYGEEDIYEQILVNLLYELCNEDIFSNQLAQMQKSCAAETIDAVLTATQQIKVSTDYEKAVEVLSEQTIESIVDNKLAMSTLMELKIQEIDENRATFYQILSKKSFAAKMGEETFYYAVSCVQSTYELTALLTQYGTMREMLDSLCALLDEMYRKSSGKMQVAIANVRVKLEQEAKDERAMLDRLEESQGQAAGEQDRAKQLIETGTAIIEVVFDELDATKKAVDLVVNLGMNPSGIAEAKIFLYEQVQLEQLIYRIVCSNAKKALIDAQSAMAYNISVLFLFESIDYGQKLTAQYGEAVLDSLAGKLQGTFNGTTAKDFSDTMKTYKGAIKSAKTIFASAWSEYGKEYRTNQKAWESLKNTTISDDTSDIHSLLDKMTMAMEEKREEDQKIIEEREQEYNRDYSPYYRKNENGVTVTEIIPDCIVVEKDADGKNIYKYYIPETIDGMPVTEIELGTNKRIHNSFIKSIRTNKVAVQYPHLGFYGKLHLNVIFPKTAKKIVKASKEMTPHIS